MQTIDQALSVLDFFSEDHYEISLTQLAAYSGYDKAKTRRYLLALLKHGVVEQNARTRAYRLGAGMLRVAKIRERVVPLETVSRPVLRKLRDSTRQTAQLSMLTGWRMSLIGVEESYHARRLTLEEGDFLPLHATSAGLVVLAFSSPEFREKILAQRLRRYNEHTIVEKRRLRALLRKIAAQGYAHIASFCDGVECIASPIFNWEDQPAGAVSLAMLKLPDAKPPAEITKRRVVRAAMEVSRKLGVEPHETQIDFIRAKTGKKSD